MKFSESGVKMELNGWHIPKDSPFDENMKKLSQHIDDAKKSGNPTVQGLAEVVEFLFTAGGWSR